MYVPVSNTDPKRQCFDKDIFPILHTFNCFCKTLESRTAPVTISKSHSSLNSDKNTHRAKRMETKFYKPSFMESFRQERKAEGRLSTQKKGNTKALDTGNSGKTENTIETHFEPLYLVTVLYYGKKSSEPMAFCKDYLFTSIKLQPFLQQEGACC